MKMARYRPVAAVPILAMVVMPFARAADTPQVPPQVASPTTAATPATADATTPVAPGGALWRFSDLFAALPLSGVESWEDVLQLQPWSGSLGFSFDDADQRTKASGSATQTFSTRLFRELISLRQDNFSIFDPRLFAGSIGVGVTFEQGQYNALGVTSSDHGALSNYDFNGTFFPLSPYNLNLFASRTQDTYVQPSGSTTRANTQNQGVALRLQESSILRDREILPYFSANLLATQQYNKSTTAVGGQSFKQDDERDQLTFDFHNGTETSDLNFQYQYTRLSNYAFDEGSYSQRSVNVAHSIDFGPTLNWRLDSRANYYSRSGVVANSDTSTLDVSEFLTIDHNVDLSSNYQYQLTQQSFAFGDSTTQLLGVQVNQQLFRNLSLTGGVNGVYSSLPGGTIQTHGIAGSFNYGHVLPWGGQLSLNGGGGYSRNANHLTGGSVSVVDAPYAVPQNIGAGTAILLRDRNIITESIAVVVIKGGGVRAPATVDVDYTVRVDGDRTSLVPLPTSAVMQPGDPLNVSYVYLVPPDSQFETVSASASIGVDWSWFGFNLSHDQNNSSPLSGTDATLLLSEQRDIGLVYLRGSWDTLQVRAAGVYTRYSSDRLAYTERRLDQVVNYQPYRNLQFDLVANESRTDFNQPVHTTEFNSIRLDATWDWGTLQTTMYGAWRSFRDTEQPTETIEAAGFRVRRTWTLLDVGVFAFIQRRTRGDVTTQSANFHIGLLRRF